jgi:hypothetical protein
MALTSCMFSLARLSLGCTIWPVTFRLPWITIASSGRSVLIPTRPAWKIDSGVWPFCQQSSTSLSNWPGFDAWNRKAWCLQVHCSRRYEVQEFDQNPRHKLWPKHVQNEIIIFHFKTCYCVQTDKDKHSFSVSIFTDFCFLHSYANINI